MIEHRDADLTGSRFRNVDLSGTRIRSAFLRDVVITDAWLEDVRIEGEIGSLTVLHCVHVVLNEEWWHHHYAARDLAILEQRQP